VALWLTSESWTQVEKRTAFGWEPTLRQCPQSWIVLEGVFDETILLSCGKETIN
jgi:hypothetical protein